jgi:hypothetical protein
VVFEKVDALAAPAYPRIRPVLEALARLEPSKIEAGWRDLIDEFTQ